MIGCLWLPYISTLAWPDSSGQARLFVRCKGRRSTVVATDAQATSWGITPGQTLTHARGRAVGSLSWEVFDEACLNPVVEKLLICAWEVTNRVELDADMLPQAGLLYLDFGRLTQAAAQRLGEHLASAVRKVLGTAVQIGIAAGKFTAYAAARVAGRGEVKMVSAFEAADLISLLPVDWLPCRRSILRQFDLLCIRQIGQLAALSRTALVSQFGREGRQLYELAHGLDRRRVKPHALPRAEACDQQFDPALIERTRLDLALHTLADQLAERLTARQAALHRLALTLTQDDGTTHTDTLHLLEPVSTSAGIARVAVRLLDRHKQTGPIAGLRLDAAHLVSNLPQQLSLFDHLPKRGQLVDLVSVLAARHGDCFYQAVIEDADALLPEQRFSMQRLGIS
jgi:nucleotidyltransferase/DNA polymerase involved in DNA repair